MPAAGCSRRLKLNGGYEMSSMYYYEVWVASQRYHSDKPLTYASQTGLTAGCLVAVELQRQTVLAVVVRQVEKPAFATKEIQRQITEIPLPNTSLKLVKWLQAYYPAGLGNILQAFLPASLLNKPRYQTTTAVRSKTKTKPLPDLTDEQRVAVKTISVSKATTLLLHGETGSGKTRVYQELIRQQLAAGKSTVVLTPEIGLTPQLAASLRSALNESVMVIHSMLSPAEKRQAWLTILAADKPLTVVGTRSALLSPIKNVGLIVMDEAHDAAYKQEQAPNYQTSRLAAKLAALHGAKLLLGTATPLVADYYALQVKKLPIIRMAKPAIRSTKPPEVTVVKLEDRQNFSKSAYLSDQLISRIVTALAHNRQSLVFLNRRGTARIVMCQSCGWQALCLNCDIALTYHGDSHSMVCHTCGRKTAAPNVCPNCSNPDIIFKGIGTKYLVNELSRLFPSSKIQRFDTDNLKSERLEHHYDSIKKGDVDILVGTQLLSKGLDLPKLSVIGVVLADTGLLIPDFTANEITYQQLTQIIGRVGRGHTAGSVVVQSYQPDNPAIQAAIRRDYRLFYEQELHERQLYGFPPFKYLLQLECRRASRKSAEAAAAKLAGELSERNSQVEIIGPSPAFHEKAGNKYRWQLVIKSGRRTHLTEIIKQLPANWSYDIDPVNLL